LRNRRAAPRYRQICESPNTVGALCLTPCLCWGLSLLLPRRCYRRRSRCGSMGLKPLEASTTDYFDGASITCGTPAGDHEMRTRLPANLPADRIIAEILAMSFFACLSLGLTVKDVKRSALPTFKLVRAFTNSAGALDLRPRRVVSASLSLISSNSK